MISAEPDVPLIFPIKLLTLFVTKPEIEMNPSSAGVSFPELSQEFSLAAKILEERFIAVQILVDDPTARDAVPIHRART
jgi:hypothetical protein